MKISSGEGYNEALKGPRRAVSDRGDDDNPGNHRYRGNNGLSLFEREAHHQPLNIYCQP